MTTLGWILLAVPLMLAVYTYGLYPLALRLFALWKHSPATPAMDEWPLVSIVIPAYNEEAQIAGTVEALLAQDYRTERRQILVVSDASSDRTDDIVRSYADRGVELLRMPTRGGKTAAENASAKLLRGEIIVNSDASVRLHPAAVRRLVEAMRDPQVGVASTRDVSFAHAADSVNATEAGYVDYEMWVRALETETGGIVGASGSGYAIRATLHRIPIRQDLSRDFSAALTARTHGFAAVSVDAAVCFVPRTSSLRAEYKRKVRTIARGMETLLSQSHLLDPMVYGSFAWKLISHKVCRWLVPPAALIALVGLAFLAVDHAWARMLLALAVVVGLVAAIGARLLLAGRRVPRPLSLVTFAVAANLAVVHAWLRVAVGHEDHLWEPTRRLPTA